MNVRAFLNCCAIMGTMLFIACSAPNRAGSETTNGISIAVAGRTVEGKTLAGTVVIICDADYNPLDSAAFIDSLTVDSTGTFTLTNVPLDTYNVFAYPPRQNEGAAVRNVPVALNTAYADSAWFDSLCRVSGSVVLQGGPQRNAAVYIEGSLFATKSDTTGYFALSKIPKGDFPIVADIYIGTYWGGEIHYSDRQQIAVGNSSANITLDLKPVP